jgi:hypothetical protein
MHRKRLRLWALPGPTPSFFFLLAAALFALGLLSGYLLSCRLQGATAGVTLALTDPGPVTAYRLFRLFWSGFRWLLAAGLLALSALGLFLLYPLVFLRGLFLGFGFSTVFLAGSRLEVLFHFLLVALLNVSPLLVLTAVGMVRALEEASDPKSREASIPPTVIFLLLLLALVLTFFCCLTELWLLPGFAFYS